jgi:hypothetical protein
MEVLEHHLDSWKEFKEFAYDYMFDARGARRGDFIFRGQSNASWQLVASLDRKYGGHENWAEIELALMSEFARKCQNIKDLEDLLNHSDRAVAFAQHHGLPTRMLDWTDSPYIAAYFAFEGALDRRVNGSMVENDRVAVWVAFMGAPIWDVESGSETVHFMSVPSWRNDRMYNQAGLFSFNNSRFLSVDDYVRNSDGPADVGVLGKYTIPASEVLQKPEFCSNYSKRRADGAETILHRKSGAQSGAIRPIWRV